jgi:opacity protein-like surface antigen
MGMKRILWLSLLVSSAAVAGPLSFGIRAGVPLTDFFDTVNSGNYAVTSTTHRYIVGPSLELKLPAGFGFEVDALYRRLNYNASFNVVDVFTNNRTTGNAWEFPLLAKYRLPTPLIKPYVDAGLAFDTLSGLKQTAVSTLSPNRITTTSTSNPAELKNSTTTGFVIGIGADIHALVLHISPEIRYTRWGSSHFNIPNGSAISNQNQAEFLVGFTF